MAPISINDLPPASADVLWRRAQAAGLTGPQQVRQELLALAGRTVPIDAVVQFLHQERPGYRESETSASATVLSQTYGLPATAATVLARRAAAAGQPAVEYLRSELNAAGRRRTLDDDVLEFHSVLGNSGPGQTADAAAFTAAVQYARGH